MFKSVSYVLSFVLFLIAAPFAQADAPAASKSTAKFVQPHPSEKKHFSWLKQLTFEGTNAEAYFSADSKKLIFQGRRDGQKCDHVYMMNLDGSNQHLVKANGGRFTCSYFTDLGVKKRHLKNLAQISGLDKTADRSRILFSSTSTEGPECPAERDKSKGYVWEIFKSYEIYSAKRDGSDVRQITHSPGYDAESTVCDGKVVFSSARSGNSLHIYTMNLDGSNVKQLTKTLGYNGGPFFSPDCKKIVYRAYHPKTLEETTRFTEAVKEGYIPPGTLEIFVMHADGSKNTQLTELEKASFAPSFFPDQKQVVFSSNLRPGKYHREFQLWTINASQSKQKTATQITSGGTFNGFPMFSPDGKYLVFASNRNSKNPHNLNVFLAKWKQ